MVGPPGPLLRPEPWLERCRHGRRLRPAPAPWADDRRRADHRRRRAFREEIEVRTDELERPIVDALGDDLDELLEHLDAWSEAIIAAGSYPQRIAGVYNVGGGPHFGSGLTIDTAAEHYQKKT